MTTRPEVDDKPFEDPQSPPREVDDNFWGDQDAANSAAEQPPDPATRDDNVEPLDVDSTPVPVKRSKVVPIVFGLVFLAALAIAGSALWTGYQKFGPKKPAQKTQVATGGALIDAAAVGGASAPGTPSPTSLPMPGNSGSGAILMSPQPAASAPAPSVMTPASAAGVSGSTTAAIDPAAVSAQAAVDAAAKAQAAQEKAAQEKATQAQEAQAAKESATQEKAAKAQAAKEEATREKAAKAQAAKEKAAQEKAAKAQKAQATKEKATQEKAAKAQTAKETAKKEVRVAKARTKRTPDKTDTEVGQGVLRQYRVMSIWPRNGEFQQAWIKDEPTGRIHIVRVGDVLDGMRVLSVDSKTNAVRMDQGEVR